MHPSQQEVVVLRARLRKSRHGCQTCKQRKIKCDEVRPVCGNCARRYYNLERCDYPAVPTPRQRQVRQLMRDDGCAVSPPPSHAPPVGPDLLSGALTVRPAGLSASYPHRQLEMRLMYHYTQFAALELPATYGYTSKELWLEKVPQMAFESDLLLDSLMTVAALHMQDLMPQDNKIDMAVNHYLDRTLAKHRYSLGHIDQSLAEPLFLTAFMLCIASWQLEHRRAQTPEAYRIPSNVFAIVRGCCALHREYNGWLAKAGYDPEAVWSHAPSRDTDQTDHPLLCDIKQDVEKLLDAFNVTSMPTDEAIVYQDTAECVISLYKALVMGEESTILQRLVFTMAVRMKSQYVAMLEAGKPLALALYARILCVLGFIDHMWWSRGSSSNRDILHYSIHGICKMMPKWCSWAMEWPLKVVAKEITFTR